MEGQWDLLLSVRTPPDRRDRANRHQDAPTVSPGERMPSTMHAERLARRREHLRGRQTANISENTQMDRQRVAAQQQSTAKRAHHAAHHAAHHTHHAARTTEIHQAAAGSRRGSLASDLHAGLAGTPALPVKGAHLRLQPPSPPEAYLCVCWERRRPPPA